MTPGLAGATGSRAEDLRAAIRAGLAASGPPPAWSMIVTVFGDVVVPRGGTLWTGSLIAILGLLGYGEGVVRTALSRLAADGWLESAKDGRRSHHALTEKGLAETLAAAERIYAGAPPCWDGTLEVALLVEPDAGARAGLRRRLAAAGFGIASPDTLVRPRLSKSGAGAPQPAESASAPGFIRVAGPVDGEGADALGALAARAWDLDKLATAYHSLGDRIGGLVAAIAAGCPFAPAEALAARILLVHEWRRVVLRDPGLPEALLSADWIGHRCRDQIAAAYRALLAPSEAWLSQEAEGAAGPLPEPGAALRRRFSI